MIGLLSPRPRLGLERLETRAVPSSSWISDASTFPYSAAVHLLTTFPNGQQFTSSGALIDNYHVLTAGHCVYDGADGGYASKIAVYPGQTGSNTPFGYALMSGERTTASFIADSNQNSANHDPGDGDIGLIALDRPLGRLTGSFYFGYNNSDSFFQGLAVHKLGYPAAPPDTGRDLLADDGFLSGTDGGSNGWDSLKWSTQSMTLIAGESGSGVYALDGSGRRTIYGVLDVGDSQTGWAERINQNAFNTLSSWIAQDKEPAALTTATSLQLSQTNLQAGQSVTLSATVAARLDGLAPQGPVVFLDGGRTVGTVTLSPGPGSTATASVTVSGLTAGTHDFQVEYTPPTYFSSSESAGQSVTVSSTDAMPTNLGTLAASIAHSSEHYQLVVREAYQQFLGRAPEPAGLSFWTGQLLGGLSQERLEASFIASPEYVNDRGGDNRDWVIGMYGDLLNRTPAESEVQFWLGQLAGGASPSAVAYGFAASPEREGIRVRGLYQQLLGRTAASFEVDFWVGQFEAGARSEDVAAGFVGSPEYYGEAGKGNSRRADWVASAYLDLLDRAASANEVNAWLMLMG